MRVHRPQSLKWGMFFILMLVFWLNGQHQVSAFPLTYSTERIEGSTRIETAIQVSQAGWQQASTVIIARADNFPDSLVAVPLAHQLDAPILLSYTDKLAPQVLVEIQRLQAKNVILLGSSLIMGETVTKPLDQAGLTWERIGGKDRYETAALVSERLGSDNEAILVSGENFPDALAISAYAGIQETPILLTTKSMLPDFTRSELQKLNPNRILVIGGEAVIPPATLKDLTEVQRIAGANRYETAAKAFWFAQTLFASNQAYLVTGENFPDALVAGALAAKMKAPLFLSDPKSLPPMIYSAMNDAAISALQVNLIGGAAVLSDQVRKMLEGLITPPYLLADQTIVLDPGHGGQDSGAIGATGTLEKNNTLPVALALADLLRAIGAKVILTRIGDVLPTESNYKELDDLKARVDSANNAKADLFISIHNDAFSNPTAGGTTTYYSSDNPQSIGSKKLALSVQAEVYKKLNLYNRSVKDAGFYVLRHTTMPAVLVELGFISNPTEEKLLGSIDFQKESALGIYRGILVYKGLL